MSIIQHLAIGHTCERHPWGQPSGLHCLRTEPHTTGHIYESSTASHLDDRHLDGGHE